MTTPESTAGVGERPETASQPSPDGRGAELNAPMTGSGRAGKSEESGSDHGLHDAWVPLIAGLIGSLLLLFGSVGIGWVGTSSVLWRNPVFTWMRVEPIGAALSISSLAIGGMLLVRAWLRLGQRAKGWPPASGRIVKQAIVLWGLPMMFAIPLFSRDVYAYIAQGRLVQAGVDPYLNGISSVSNWFGLGADKLWAEAPTPYGPVFLWIEQAVVEISAGSPELSVFLFRLTSVFGIVLCMIYVPRLAVLHGVNPHRALWLSVANPLLLVNFIAAVHNDALMIGLAVAGLYYCATKRGFLGVVLITLSIAVKPITVILLPFAGLLWAGKKAGWSRKFLFWGLTAALSLGLMALMGWINGFGFGWINGLSAPGSVWIWYAPVGAIGLTVATVAGAFGWDGWGIAHGIWNVAKVVAIGLVAWLMFRGTYERIIRRMALAFAAVVLLAPMIQSWYVVWLIPLFAVTGIRNDWQVKSLYFILSFFMIYAISDQLNVYPYLQQRDAWLSLDNARIAAALIGLGFALYIVLVDRKTRKLFLQDQQIRDVI
ncbi:MAG: polyprenol phosphomannose-dependent alpha 1,6 mannosyltransferase MptB [Renibacterium sp.]|nr:polyprenol phosphomannose-dependent alpha 1,6 mannosyltransferase MptB [Renibacterium sp.]